MQFSAYEILIHSNLFLLHYLFKPALLLTVCDPLFSIYQIYNAFRNLNSLSSRCLMCDYHVTIERLLTDVLKMTDTQNDSVTIKSAQMLLNSPTQYDDIEAKLHYSLVVTYRDGN